MCAMMTANPRLLVLSESQPKKNTTPSARKPPTDARAFASTRLNPKAMMMVGVYVVRDDHVENTAKVDTKEAQRR